MLPILGVAIFNMLLTLEWEVVLLGKGKSCSNGKKDFFLLSPQIKSL